MPSSARSQVSVFPRLRVRSSGRRAGKRPTSLSFLHFSFVVPSVLGRRRKVLFSSSGDRVKHRDLKVIAVSEIHRKRVPAELRFLDTGRTVSGFRSRRRFFSPPEVPPLQTADAEGRKPSGKSPAPPTPASSRRRETGNPLASLPRRTPSFPIRRAVGRSAERRRGMHAFLTQLLSSRSRPRAKSRIAVQTNSECLVGCRSLARAILESVGIDISSFGSSRSSIYPREERR